MEVMRLTVKERIILLTVLPQEGTLDTIKIVHELRNALSFDEEEHKQMNIKRLENGSYEWDENSRIIKEVVIGEVGKNILKEELEKLDVEGKVTEMHLGLFNKFA
tara:strand:+ start:214 stop:528 length:315 start_codon:yes stop_codon:yes gene_type:complete